MTANSNDLEPLEVVETDGDYSLLLTAGDTAVDSVVAELGHEPNGYLWEGVARWLIASEAKQLEGLLDMDPEAGMFAAYGADENALISLGKLMAPYANSGDKIRALVAEAQAAGFDFDD